MLGRLILYLVTLAIYTPYAIVCVRRRYYIKFPFVFFTYMGMYVLNALGSIYMYLPGLFPEIPRTDYFSYSFAIALNLQAVIFFVFAVPYTRSARPVALDINRKGIGTFTGFIALFAVIGGLIAMYAKKVGVPPGLENLSGSLLTQSAVIAYRVNNTYFLPDYNVYNLGFTTFPLVVAALAWVSYLRYGKIVYFTPLLLCMFVSIFPGGKGNILDMVQLLLIILVIWNHSGHALSDKTRKKLLWLVGSILLVSTGFVVMMYRLYYGSDMAVGTIAG